MFEIKNYTNYIKYDTKFLIQSAYCNRWRKCSKVFLTIVSWHSSVNISPHSNCFYVHEWDWFLSRFTSAPKIPMRFGEFLVHRRLGLEIRVRNKQTSARRATYSLC